jgi:uncharacterized protein YggU (UPF0235/DUF167 family)
MPKQYIIVAHTRSVQPRVVLRDGEFHVYTNEKPIQQKANKAILASLAEYLKLPKSRLKLLRGTTAKKKVFVQI